MTVMKILPHSVTRDTFSKGGKILLKRGKKRWKIFFVQRWKIKVENYIKKELDIFSLSLKNTGEMWKILKSHVNIKIFSRKRKFWGVNFSFQVLLHFYY